MKCTMCGTSYCSCKSKCSSCWLGNKDVYFVNECIKNWLTKEEARQNLSLITQFNKKIDSVSLVEYIHWELSKEKFDESVASYHKKPEPKKKEETYNPMLGKPNPTKQCVFPKWGDIWSRCIFCNGIKRYMNGKQCPQYVEYAGSTDAKN